MRRRGRGRFRGKGFRGKRRGRRIRAYHASRGGIRL